MGLEMSWVLFMWGTSFGARRAPKSSLSFGALRSTLDGHLISSLKTRKVLQEKWCIHNPRSTPTEAELRWGSGCVPGFSGPLSVTDHPGWCCSWGRAVVFAVSTHPSLSCCDVTVFKKAKDMVVKMASASGCLPLPSLSQASRRARAEAGLGEGGG